MGFHKNVLTTGEVAKICSVAPRTVSKWFDTGQLRGYRIPGSKDRRIPLDQLVRFMRAHGIPLDGLETGITRILIVEHDDDVLELLSNALSQDAGYEVHRARSAFEAGAATESFRPHAMLLDIDLAGLSGRETIRFIQGMPELGACKLIAITGPLPEGDSTALKQQGFDGTIAKPFEISDLVRTIEQVLGPEAAR